MTNSDDLIHECAIFLARRRARFDAGDSGDTVLPIVLEGLKLQGNRGQEGYGIAATNPGTETPFEQKFQVDLYVNSTAFQR